MPVGKGCAGKVANTVLMEGLFTTITNVNFNDATLAEQIAKTGAAQGTLAAYDMKSCGSIGIDGYPFLKVSDFVWLGGWLPMLITPRCWLPDQGRLTIFCGRSGCGRRDLPCRNYYPWY